MESGANFDRTRAYRWRLWRAWDTALPTVAFVMLNPSTADALRDDPTIRRCLAFAQAWGFGRLEVVNLFAWRAADPSELRTVPDPVGRRNDEFVRRIARRADLVVAAWGNRGSLGGRDAEVWRMIGGAAVLGWTAAGQPRHPLYVGGGTKPLA